MSRSRTPTPVENTGSKPYRVYADVYGDPASHSHRPIVDAMSPVLAHVAPAAHLAEIRQLLERQHLGGAPVVDADERLLGVVTWEHLATAPGDATAGQVMRHALALPSWTRIGKAAAIMAWEGIDLAAVVDDDRRVLGLLSALDLVRWLAREDGYVLTR